MPAEPCKIILGVLRQHHFALSCALILTILIFLPLIVFPFLAGDSYNGINIPHHHGYDYYYYLSRGKEVLEGHNLGNMALREGKNFQDPIFNYSEKIIVSPVRWLGLGDKIDIVTLYNAYNFVGIFILILLIYFFALELSNDKKLSLATALFVVGGYSIIYNRALFYTDFNVYARPMYPYLSSLLFFSYLFLLIKNFKTQNYKLSIASGFLFGLMFYVYFYAWTFTLALNGVLFLLFIFKKDYSNLKKIFLISSIGVLLGSYNVIRMFLFFVSDGSRQVSYFFSSVHNHIPIFSKIGAITSFLFVVYFYKRRGDKNSWFILALIFAGWIALNQQIITNTVLQYGHYYWFFIVPVSIVVSFYMVWFLIEKNWFRILFFITICLLVFLNTAVGQYRSMFTVLEIKNDEQRYAPILDFFNKEEKESKVIFTTNNNIASLYMVYTNHDLFWLDAAALYNAPLERMKEAMCVYLYLNKYSRNNIIEYLNKLALDKNSSSFYKSTYQKIEGYSSGFDYYTYVGKDATDDAVILKHREKTIFNLDKSCREKIKLDGSGALEILKKYDVSYFVWDHKNNPEWDISFMINLKKIVSFNDIDVYSLSL